MTRAAFGVVFVCALAVGLAFRFTAPDVRPMHHDEANQAVRFGTLLETGEYRYDRHDHHGPTLYYLTLPFAWLRGQHALSVLDERTMRMVPAVFGVATLLLLLFLVRGLGGTAVAAAATLAAVSPIITFYSRFYIQETLFVFFALAFVIALGYYAVRPRFAPALWVGALGGLAYATKETSIIVLPSAVLACGGSMVLARESLDSAIVPVRTRIEHASAALAAAFLPAFLLYTGFLRNWSGLLDSFSAFSIYFSRGLEAGPHVHPWFTYLQMLGWSRSGGLVFTEGLILVLAVTGIVQAIATRRTAFWPIYIAVYTLLTTAIFSAVRYKTPWNALPFYVPIVVMAGIGLAALLARVRRPALQAVVLIAFAGATWQLAAQNVRANFKYPADPRNPYVYAHTSPDFLRLARRVHDLAAVHSQGRDMLVKVVAGPYEQWPFPWYARDLAYVGYWSRPEDAGALDDAAVVIASQENAPAVEAALGERYVSEFYGLRPEVLLTIYIERGLWDRFLESRQ